MRVFGSRGNGTAQAFFNVYIQDPYAGDGTTAPRGDPVQFDYPGLGALGLGLALVGMRLAASRTRRARQPPRA